MAAIYGLKPWDIQRLTPTQEAFYARDLYYWVDVLRGGDGKPRGAHPKGKLSPDEIKSLKGKTPKEIDAYMRERETGVF